MSPSFLFSLETKRALKGPGKGIPRWGLSAVLALSLGALPSGCDDTADPGPRTGGKKTGGSGASGGSPATGGSGTGGTPASGGSATGGTTVANTGGTPGSGGSAPVDGGAGKDGGTGDAGPMGCPEPPTALIKPTVTWANVNSQKPEWYSTPEAVQVAENILYYQTTTGSWTTQIDMTTRDAYKHREDFGFHKQLVYLSKMIEATGCDRYKTSFLKAINRIIQVQSTNGAWPEMTPYGVYYDVIVRYTDEGMTGYIGILNEIAKKLPKYAFVDDASVAKCKAAVDKGVDFLLKAQVVAQGKKTAWPAHSHKTTYLPHRRSPHEIPAISGSDSVNVFNFLMTLEKPSPEVVEAIHTAAAWYDAVKVVGKKYVDAKDDAGVRIDRVVIDDPTSTIWARFYDPVGGKDPIFAGDDGVIRTNLLDVPQDRRAGFAWYVTTPAAALKTYETWKTTTGAGTSAPDGGVVGDGGVVVKVDGGADAGSAPTSCGPTPVSNISFKNDPAGKPRVIATTDGERDDKSTMVRFLLYSSDYDVAGIVEVNSRYQRNGHSGEKWIQAHLDAYDQVRPNLVIHHPGYPETAKLREVLKVGNENINDIHRAPGNFQTQDTDGAKLIIDTLLDSDPRPVHLQSWGGANTTAYALYKIKTSYPPAEFQRAVAKARIYAIYYQDSGGYWIEDNIPGAYIYESYAWDTVWNYQSIFGPSPQEVKAFMDAKWLTGKVTVGHGPLGARYSLKENEQTYISEGDTPSFFPLINNGLDQHVNYTFGGWGGRPVFDWGLHMSDGYDSEGSVVCDRNLTYWRWIPAAQNDFEARMDWSMAKTLAEANHNPMASVVEKKRTVKGGTTVTLDASASKDPDNHTLTYKWWQYAEADSATAKVTIANANTAKASFVVPNEPGKQVHIILEATDNGTPPLTHYQRVIVDIF